MNYTQSPDYAVHTSGKRMHKDSGPVDTVWSANDANMIIWSLMKLLADASVTGAASFDPDDAASYSKVSDAVAARAALEFTGSAVNTGTNGYQKLPSGLILQWGEYTSDIAVANSGPPTLINITFPVAFPNACRNVSLTTRDAGNDPAADSWPALNSRSTTGFAMAPQNAGNGMGSNLTLHGFLWTAIGY